MSFMVRDDYGNVWPPFFRSRLVGDPSDPLTMIRSDLSLRMSAITSARKEAKAKETRESRQGWGNGTIAGLKKKARTD